MRRDLGAPPLPTPVWKGLPERLGPQGRTKARDALGVDLKARYNDPTTARRAVEGRKLNSRLLVGYHVLRTVTAVGVAVTSIPFLRWLTDPGPGHDPPAAGWWVLAMTMLALVVWVWVWSVRSYGRMRAISGVWRAYATVASGSEGRQPGDAAADYGRAEASLLLYWPYARTQVQRSRLRAMLDSDAHLIGALEEDFYGLHGETPQQAVWDRHQEMLANVLSRLLVLPATTEPPAKEAETVARLRTAWAGSRWWVKASGTFVWISAATGLITLVGVLAKAFSKLVL